MFYTSLQLDTLQYLIDKQKLDASKPITLKELFKVGGIGKIRDGIALTARVSEISTKRLWEDECTIKE
jgi:hypothetical protein